MTRATSYDTARCAPRCEIRMRYYGLQTDSSASDSSELELVPVGPELAARPGALVLQLSQLPDRNSRRPLKITRNDAPMSAAMAAQSEL